MLFYDYFVLIIIFYFRFLETDFQEFFVPFYISKLLFFVLVMSFLIISHHKCPFKKEVLMCF